MGPVEVITSVERRRRWSAEGKRALVEEAEQPGMSISVVARKYGKLPNQLFKWRRLLQAGTLTAMRTEEEVVLISEVRSMKTRDKEQERLLGKKTMEVEILKDAIEIAREKKLISRFLIN